MGATWACAAPRLPQHRPRPSGQASHVLRGQGAVVRRPLVGQRPLRRVEARRERWLQHPQGQPAPPKASKGKEAGQLLPDRGSRDAGPPTAHSCAAVTPGGAEGPAAIGSAPGTKGREPPSVSPAAGVGASPPPNSIVGIDATCGVPQTPQYWNAVITMAWQFPHSHTESAGVQDWAP